MTKPTREKRITSLKRVVAVQTEFPVTNLREALEIISEQAAEIAELKAMKFSKVTRVEVIDKNGRSYVNYGAEDVEISLQDDDRTMKIFCRKN